MNRLKSELLAREEEVAECKARLKQLEDAFCYNLNLISDRDMQLDVLEEQLEGRIQQLQRALHENTEFEEKIKQMEQQRLEQMKYFHTQLTCREKVIHDLERKNKANVNTLKQTLENINQEHEDQMREVTSQFMNEKNQWENCFKMRINEMRKKHEREMKVQFEKNIVEIENSMHIEADNVKMRREIMEHKKSLEVCQGHIERMKMQYNIALEELTADRNKQFSDKQVMIKPTTHAMTTQTESLQNCPDPREMLMLQQQNELLRAVIKDLKRNKDNLSENKTEKCECSAAFIEMRETNKKIESELSIVKKLLQEEQEQKNEEESTIQELETSIACLKDRLLSSVQQNMVNNGGCGAQDGNPCCKVSNREIYNEMRMTMAEHRLSKMERTMQENNVSLMEKMEVMKKDCLERLDQFFTYENCSDMKSDNLLMRIRQGINKLENKIENDMKNTTSQISSSDSHLQTASLLNNKLRRCAPPEAKNVPPVVYYVQNTIPETEIKRGSKSGKATAVVRHVFPQPKGNSVRYSSKLVQK